jgi:hypothetical protein
MIRRKTTLVLGAGASAPFGFPTGYELLRKVVDWANTSPGQTNPILFSEFKGSEIKEFREALEKSGKMSVDSFLEHRPEFIPIGKRAMAMALIQCEHQPHLFKRDGKSWYEYLFYQLDAPFDDFSGNQLKVLTFNYDRSLEHFLFTALKNSSGKTEDECASKLNSIPIIHLHGDIGNLPHINQSLARHYNTNITPDLLDVATKRIKIIHEKTTDDFSFELARKFLSESEVICFLGFGYHPINIERLGIRNRITGLGQKIRLGSTFGLTGVESNHCSELCGFPLRRSSTLDYRNLDVLGYLRESGALLGG